MKIDNLLEIGQLLFKVDENSLIVIEVKDWDYNSRSGNILYTLGYLHSKDDYFEVYEEDLYSYLNEHNDESLLTPQWFDTYKEAQECLQVRVAKYQKSWEKH